jgi:hypothetical protein
MLLKLSTLHKTSILLELSAPTVPLKLPTPVNPTVIGPMATMAV